jgi:outer membrane cobalamin receptor
MLAFVVPGVKARGQDAGTDPSETAQAPPVFYTTATVVARPLSSATSSVTVIDHAEVVASGARSAADLLQFAAGVTVLPSGGRAGLTTASIRGGDPNFTLVLLDGIPLNDATDPLGGIVNLETLPAESIERIEIVRGALCSFYGSSGLAGIVHIFTRRGAIGREVGGGLGTEVGSASLLKTNGWLSGPLGRGGYSVRTSWEQEKARVGNDRFQQLDLQSNGRVVVGSEGELRLTARFVSSDTSDYPEASGGPFLGSGQLRKSEGQQLSLGAEMELGPASGRRHTLAFGFNHRSQDRVSPAVGEVVPSSDEKTTYSRLRLGWQAPLHRTEQVSLNVGVSAENERGENAGLLHLPPDFGGDIPSDYNKNRSSAGTNVELLYRPGRWLLEAATRIELAETAGVQASPRLGLSYRLGSGATRLRASAGRAFKLPSLFALASPPQLGGNPDLNPERAIGGEVGVEHALRTIGLDVGAAFFVNRYRDLIDFDFASFRHVNRSEVRAHGAELTFDWSPRPVFALQGDLTWLVTKDAGSSEPLLHRPRWSGGARVTWKPLSRLSLRLDGRAVARNFDHQIPVPELDSVSGYRVVGLGGSWRVKDRWTLRMRIDNALDEGYETLIGFPGPKRSFRIGLVYDTTP